MPRRKRSTSSWRNAQGGGSEGYLWWGRRPCFKEGQALRGGRRDIADQVLGRLLVSVGFLIKVTPRITLFYIVADCMMLLYSRA